MKAENDNTDIYAQDHMITSRIVYPCMLYSILHQETLDPQTKTLILTGTLPFGDKSGNKEILLQDCLFE